MKSFFLKSIACIFFLCAGRAGAQTPVDTSNIGKQLKYLVQPLDKNQIPTGFLVEQGTIFWDMAYFNGVLSDNNFFVPNMWRTAYVQFRESYCGTGSNPLPDIVAVNNAIQLNKDVSLPTPIPILIGEYNYLKSDAITSNLLSYNSTTRQLYDVANRPSSPYLLRNVFAACPFSEYSDKGTESFIVKSDLVYNSTGFAISSVQVDFGNGQGYVNMPMNTPVNVSYADTGYYVIKVKATLSNNSVFECSSEYYVVNIQNVASRYTAGGINGSFVPTGWGIINPVPGVHSGGTIHVVLSSKSRSTQIRKPLIVVENMDAYKLAPQLQEVPYTVASFIQEMDLIIGYDLNKELDEIAGYDLIFIDFADGMDGIVRNAEVVKEAINLINLNRAPIDDRSGIREQNVVLGIGTGGLNARYALANMVKNFAGTPTETRLLITHDAPHRGSNIALSLQYLAKFINKSTSYSSYSLGQLFPEHAQSVAYFDAPVNRDILMYRAIVDQTGDVENSFIANIYQPMVTFTTPAQPFRFVATSLGNECARPVFQSGRIFMDFGESQSFGLKLKLTLSFLKIISKKLEDAVSISIPLIESKNEIQIFARDIPASNESNREIAKCKNTFKIILFGFITVTKSGIDATATAPSHFLPVDGVPGSFKTMLDFRELWRYADGIGNFYFSIEEKLFSFPIIKGVVKGSIAAFFKAKEYNSGVFSTQYTEVPVGSALDVAPFNSNTFTQYYANGNNAIHPSSSDTYIAQETVLTNNLFNNVSRRFTARNSRFIFKEMENVANLENCSAECGNPLVLEGPNDICASANYQVQGIRRGTSFSWTVSPSSGIVSHVANGTQITLTRIGSANGYVLLTANIGAGCSPATTITKQIAVGSPAPVGVIFENTDPLCIDHRAPLGVKTVTVYPQLPGTTYQWQVNGVTRNGNGGVFTIIHSWCVNGTNSIRVRAYKCDTWSAWSEFDYFEATWCGTRMTESAYTMSPNPVTDKLTIGANLDMLIKEVRVKDKQGVVKQLIRLPEGSKIASLNLFGLPSDIYFVEVFDGKEWRTQKVIKH
jgi:hypothetical protein